MSKSNLISNIKTKALTKIHQKFMKTKFIKIHKTKFEIIKNLSTPSFLFHTRMKNIHFVRHHGSRKVHTI